MKDLLKYSFWLFLVALPSMIILGGVGYILVCAKPHKYDTTESMMSPYYMPYYNIHYENDSVKISTINFPSEEPYLPGITEVWSVNKISGDSILCAKSNPHYFGRGRDSIPSIVNVMYRPDKGKLIVEGPTCHAGTMATYIVNAKTGEYLCLPTNYGFVGYTNWNDYLLASSKFNDIDYDLVLWYENIYVLDWDGKIISYSSTKEGVIEEALPLVHHEAGWDIEEIKLDKHIRLSPQYPDSFYYDNEFQVKYHAMSMKEIANMDSSNSLPKGWSKHGKKYYYYSDDPEYGMFLTILVDSQYNTGIIRKGAYSNPQNKPKRQYE